MRWRLPDWLKGGVVGGLVGSIISGLIVAAVSGCMETDRRRVEFQREVFRSFNTEAIETLNHLTDLYKLDVTDQTEFHKVRRQAAFHMNALIWNGNDLYLAFRDDSLFGDGQDLKQALQQWHSLVRQRPISSDKEVELRQCRALKLMKRMQQKMAHEIGRMSGGEYEAASRRNEQALRDDCPR